MLKARIANITDKDFIEIELPRDHVTFSNLLSLMCEELGIAKDLVLKVRKLPDTILRKDKDVQRLVNFQELELVLTPKGVGQLSETQRGFTTAAPRHVDILY